MALRDREMMGRAVELPEPWRSTALTVVLPTYNEAANLPVIVGELFGLPLTGLRILVADDNSPDGTGVVARCCTGRASRASAVPMSTA
jgi:dolichol-phosphate mannosyltransferase